MVLSSFGTEIIKMVLLSFETEIMSYFVLKVVAATEIPGHHALFLNIVETFHIDFLVGLLPSTPQKTKDGRSEWNGLQAEHEKRKGVGRDREMGPGKKETLMHFEGKWAKPEGNGYTRSRRVTPLLSHHFMSYF